MRVVLALMIAGTLAAACASFSAGGGDAPDASTGDGSAIDGARPDAPIGPPADGSFGFCADAGTHDLCEDFDRQPLDAGGWTVGALGPGTDAAVEEILDTNFVSPPSSLLVDLHSNGGLRASTSIHRAWPKASTLDTVLAFDLFVDILVQENTGTTDAVVATVGDNIYALEVSVSLAAPAATLDVVLAEIGTSVGGGKLHVVAFSQNFVTKAWHSFVLTVDHRLTKVALTIDQLPGTAAEAFKVPKMAPSVGLDLGAQTERPNAEVKLYFDNVTLDINR